ncbi:hypothetical protein CCR94_21445 [Rhodoblastus sphagnicola]|uniref:Fe/B12 periplasmic-binding domain-containing protein n=1 Tax=Rhodoblastus sphagnicola TaxID=333368 RepID=A0A2S6MX98_9HYPH|nr:hypothetical protein [Rhodoblastus sphagnicola]MBB4199327.1 ABC-type Fe3+-hydroxamate transport system substrate-binding protein [Rhodoblastus sphagnicola]PPQ26986.1 hypothetical protein CCR94_21445 [Rhodoblastus sphagnicola]
MKAPIAPQPVKSDRSESCRSRTCPFLSIRVERFPPWAARTNPSLSAIATFASQPNLEDSLARHPDLALVSANYGLKLSTLAAFGVPALVSQSARPARSAMRFIEDARTMVRLVGDAVGAEAPTIAEAWRASFDERPRFIQSRVAAIPPKKRLSLYYARFYRTRLSDDEAQKLLDGRSPDGSRFNLTRN